VSDLSSWIGEIEAAVNAIGHEPALDIEAARHGGVQGSFLAAGLVGAVPLWSGSSVAIGLMAIPGVEPCSWPVVALERGQAITLASDAATAFPRFVMLRLLSNNLRGAEHFSSRWPETGRKATDLHAALGGAADALGVVQEAASDPTIRNTFAYRKDQVAAFEAAHSLLARKIDRSEPFSRFADWLDAWVSGGDESPDYQSFGSWRRQSLCLFNAFNRISFAGSSPGSALLEVIEAHAGLDSGVPNTPTWALHPANASGEARLAAVARVIDHSSKIDDEIGLGLVKALVAEGMDYNGFAHAEAVVALDESGQPERSWRALHSAAWWMARSTGEVPPAILDGARLLCDRHGWDDIRWVVDRNAGKAA
jgi:hypothetical protein